ncbi:hypothetical protein [Helicobacter bizzozeronii]|uniref:hypothetical protein n=1 Tax=Helicobacter bizzozeronii TaxID=56877 RepID=UPI000CF0CF3E
MRPVGNALELKLCKIPTIGTQSENQTLPTGNISLGSPNVFSIWVLHCPTERVKIFKEHRVDLCPLAGSLLSGFGLHRLSADVVCQV